MDKSELSAVFEELEAIKAIARHEGYEQAIKDLDATGKKQQKDQDKVDRCVKNWHNCLQKIRQAWARVTEYDPVDDHGRRTYRALFGNVSNSSTVHDGDGRTLYGNYINMPEDMEEFTEALLHEIQKAQDFQILLDAFEKDPMVKDQWNRLLVMMKMREQ
jgi:hypothetical protein